MKNTEQILLFDGICNLCNGFVFFIIKRDPAAKFKFATLQSDFGQIQLKKFDLSSVKLKTIIYLRDEKYFLKSSAVLHALKDLGGLWKLFFVFIIIPAFIRDFFYIVIASNRYKIFGKRNTCMTPEPEIAQRFIS